MGAAGAAQAGIGAFQLIESKNQADAIRRQANFDAQQSEFNAQFLELKKPDIIAKRDDDVLRRESQVRQMIGAQKTTLAAQGIEIDSELGQQLAETEQIIGMEDTESIRNNAWREAMGIDVQASDLRTQAQVSKLEGASKARQVRTAGFLGAAGRFTSASQSFSQSNFSIPSSARSSSSSKIRGETSRGSSLSFSGRGSRFGRRVA